MQQVIEEFAYPQLQSPSIKVIEYGNQPLASPSSVFSHVSSNSYDSLQVQHLVPLNHLQTSINLPQAMNTAG